jgi:hypothetical protein
MVSFTKHILKLYNIYIKLYNIYMEIIQHIYKIIEYIYWNTERLNIYGIIDQWDVITL